MDPIIPKAIETYCTAHSTPPSPLRAELARYTEANCENPQMLVGELEGAFLQLLVRVTGAQRVLEIGTFTGYSALAMAEALPPDGEIVTCEIKPENARVAQSFFDRSEHGRKIRIALGAALESIARVEGVFDLVFVDADKENYPRYYDALLPRVRAGGLLVFDNTLWSGRVLSPARETDRAIVELNARVRADARVECVLVPLRDGVLLIRRN